MRLVPFISPMLRLMFHKHINGHPTFRFSTWGGNSGASIVFRYSEGITSPSRSYMCVSALVQHPHFRGTICPCPRGCGVSMPKH
eukprot:171822-Chlamydomonas_euryale.AAC.1